MEAGAMFSAGVKPLSDHYCSRNLWVDQIRSEWSPGSLAGILQHCCAYFWPRKLVVCSVTLGGAISAVLMRCGKAPPSESAGEGSIAGRLPPGAETGPM